MSPASAEDPTKPAATPGTWEFWIDRGGTFTDCIGRGPDGALHTAKLLSSDRAPVETIREILEREAGLAPGAPWPPLLAKIGSTVATNALLERRGVPTLVVTAEGLGDLLEIATQARPELFALAIERSAPLHAESLECGARVDLAGTVLSPADPEAAARALAEARGRGLRAVAVALPHAHAHPAPEHEVAAWARSAGFETVCCSSDATREQGLLARGQTAVVDAYLGPLVDAHVRGLEEALPGARLRFMQSSGALADARHFRPSRALLSGPAGGVLAARRVAARAGARRAIGFDMGGTSTDVSLWDGGALERAFESEVGGVRVKAPMLRIHTIAAGGGSLCHFDGIGLQVGPESAGAEPGPLCYGRPEARALALTDCNVFLGRVQGDRFPFPLHREPVERELAAQAEALAKAGHALGPEEVAAGYLAVANAGMARAIEEVSVARGVDPRDFVLVGFGGAAGQHVCAVARELEVREVLLHPLAGLLSAQGIGGAEPGFESALDGGGRILPADGEPLPGAVEDGLRSLARDGHRELDGEGEAGPRICERWLDLRYAGTDTALPIAEPATGAWREAFEAEHRTRFGYVRPGREVEIAALRVRVRVARSEAQEPVADPWARAPRPAPPPLRRARAWFPGEGFTEAPVFARESLSDGVEIAGPAIVLEGTGTLVLDPGFRARVDGDGVLRLRDEAGGDRRRTPGPDPVRLEVFGNRFMSIAEQMGAVLRNTALSTNIKERLDYSCAVFDGDGGLVANAPHIPVHLGAMGETIRVLRERLRDWRDGDVAVTNDPFSGGSHLPDGTVVTPVFVDGDSPGPHFFVASRGHQADLGGITPGSMPAGSRRLEEEGVVLPPGWLVRDGHLDEAGILARLRAGPHPARRPEDNLADLQAMVAANRAGVGLLEAFVREQGAGEVAATMDALQAAASAKVAREIGRLPDGDHLFEDAMDDGTPIRATLRVAGESLEIDFDGTGPASPGNLNAPRAVVQAAVLYVLRCLVAERFPLNGGCLRPVRLRVPAGSLLDPPPGSAVVGGNVETSQRIVDVLLGALGVAAASQGTMNNLTFGDEDFGYYETLGGGAGATREHPGASAVHTHMTNTRITDLEVLESRAPVVLRRFSIRRGSGGAGRAPGGDGLVRRIEFRRPVTVSLLSERRVRAPFGLAGGRPGARGRNRLLRADGSVRDLAGHDRVEVGPGDAVEVATPGGGGFGASEGGERGPAGSTPGVLPRQVRGVRSARARSSVGRARDS